MRRQASDASRSLALVHVLRNIGQVRVPEPVRRGHLPPRCAAALAAEHAPCGPARVCFGTKTKEGEWTRVLASLGMPGEQGQGGQSWDQ